MKREDGPCHYSSDSLHNCDSFPKWRAVSFNGKPEQEYRWCSSAVELVKRMANTYKETIEVRDLD